MAPATNTKIAAVYLTDSAGDSFGIAVPKDGKWRFLSTTYTFTGTAPTLRLYSNLTADATAGEILYADGLTVNLGLNNPVWPEPITNPTLYAFGYYDGTINAGASAVVVLNCLGAAIGDTVTVTCTDAAGLVQDMVYSGYVYAADHIRVTIRNHSGGNVTIGASYIKCAVHKDGY
jgi:hypothetical protein